jgi:hypothetical protein
MNILDLQGPIWAADKAIVIDSLAIVLAMIVTANRNHNTIPTNQLMQMQR